MSDYVSPSEERERDYNSPIQEKVEILFSDPYRFYIAPNLWILRGASRIDELKDMYWIEYDNNNVDLCNRIIEVMDFLNLKYSQDLKGYSKVSFKGKTLIKTSDYLNKKLNRNKETSDFIVKHNLKWDDFFDAKGYSIYSCYDEMKAKDKLFAYNTKPCSEFGHTLQDRNGNCVMCNTGHLAYSLRKKLIGLIYIAYSIKKEIIKVGMTTESINIKIKKLNSRNVGNTDDWELLSSIKCEKANSLKNLIHNQLNIYQVEGEFYGEIELNEIFKYSYQKVDELLESILKTQKTKIISKKLYINDKSIYNFK